MPLLSQDPVKLRETRIKATILFKPSPLSCGSDRVSISFQPIEISDRLKTTTRSFRATRTSKERRARKYILSLSTDAAHVIRADGNDQTASKAPVTGTPLYVIGSATLERAQKHEEHRVGARLTLFDRSHQVTASTASVRSQGETKKFNLGVALPTQRDTLASRGTEPFPIR